MSLPKIDDFVANNQPEMTYILQILLHNVDKSII